MHLVPPYMGHLQTSRRKHRARAGQDSKAAHPALPAYFKDRTGLKPRTSGIVASDGMGRVRSRHALVTALKEQLEPQADPQEGSTRATSNRIDNCTRPDLPRA